MRFEAAADELYGVLPSEFTATRRRLAGELSRDDARRLTAMRRPTVPAWAVNLLVRDDAVGPLLDLGERMRAAWEKGGDLGALDRERASLVDDLVRRACELAGEAGRPLSDAFADDVERTLHAATADPSAAEAVREGRLDHPLRHAGFGPFGAAAPPKPPPRREKSKDERAGRARERRAEQARVEQARAAERAAEEAERSLGEWAATAEEARRRLADAKEELDGLRERVRAAEARHADLDRRAQVAEREHDRAERAAREARRRARDLA